MSTNRGYRYIRLLLNHLHLQRTDIESLEKIGLECIDDGRDYEAYGIINGAGRESKLSQIKQLDWVEDVEFGDPPSSV